MSVPFEIRDAREVDVAAVNAVIAAAIDTWDLPARVKRLALPMYRYTQEDLGHLTIRVVEQTSSIVAVAAWEPANPRDLTGRVSGVLLHGLYVDPIHQRQGFATRLLADGADAARARGDDGILVRAQADAEGYFTRLGFERLPIRDEARDYAKRLWLSLS